MSDQGFDDRDRPDRTAEQRRAKKADSAETRARVATVIGIVFTVIAVFFVVGILLEVFNSSINPDNGLVSFVLGFDDFFDGPLNRESGIFVFDGDNARALNAVTNWGLAALLYFGLSQLLPRLIRV